MSEDYQKILLLLNQIEIEIEDLEKELLYNFLYQEFCD